MMLGMAAFAYQTPTLLFAPFRGMIADKHDERNLNIKKLLADYFPAFTHRNYRIFYIGQFFSLSGNWLNIIAQFWLIYKLTASPLMLGMAAFAYQTPALVFAPFGGMMADKYDKRKVLAITQALAALVALSLAIVVFVGVLNVAILMFLIWLLGAVNALDMPIRQSFMFEIVGKKHLINAITLNALMFNSARVIGPVLAGLVVAKYGEAWCFLLNSASYIPIFLGLIFMNRHVLKQQVVPKPATTTATSSSLIAGILFTFKTPATRFILLLVAITGFCLVPFQSFLPIYVDQVFQGGALKYGFFNGLFGIGCLAAALYLLLQNRVAGTERRIFISVFLSALSIFLFTLSKTLILSLILLVVCGFGIISVLVSVNSYLQIIAPDNLRGRVLSFFVVMNHGLAPLGALAIGGLAEILDTSRAIAFSCLLGTLAAALLYKKLPLIKASAKSLLAG